MRLFRRRPTPDEAPTTVATWTCPHCDQAVPLTAERQVLLVIDETDIEAHLLGHPEEEE